MTDLTAQFSSKTAEAGKKGTLVRLISGGVAGAISSYILTWCSLHGVDFEAWGINSEVIKSTITGFIAGFFVDPKAFVYAVVDCVLYVRFFFYNVWQAIRYGKQVDQ